MVSVGCRVGEWEGRTAVDTDGGQAEVALVGKVATACITSGGRKDELYHGRGEEEGEEEEGT